MSLGDRIKRHEGLRFAPYEDSVGVSTVGYGRNLRDVPFSQDEVDLMFDNDFRRALGAAESLVAYERLNTVRRGVLIEMCFQMGLRGVSRFKRFLDAAAGEDWVQAKTELLDSKWARQTPDRANELAEIFFEG